jgi:predicted NBD/HSP70 family sugar kinase
MNREYLIGMSLTPESYSIGLIDLSGKIIKTVEKELLIKKNKKKYLRELLEDANRIKKGRVIGVGVSVPVRLDQRDNLIATPDLFNWRQLKLRSAINDTLNIPVFLASRSDCIAMAENKAGSARKVSNAVVIDVSDEILMSVIEGSKLQRTPTNHNFMLGHMIVAGDADCKAQSFGCLNAFASRHGILKRYKKVRGKDVELADIEREGKKVKKIQTLLDEAVEHLSYAIANIFNLLAPDQIILSTSYQDMQPLLEKAAKRAPDYFYMTTTRKGEVILSRLSDAGIIGAASLVKR